jgi:Domain of unknown function (DUF4166)
MGHLARLWNEDAAVVRRTGRALQADMTFRRLIGMESWRRLPECVRARFSVKPAKDGAIRFTGRMAVISATRPVRLLAQLCRLIGGPLPWRVGCDLPATITLSIADGGVAWARCYRFPDGGVVRARSVKIERGGELVERIGGGFEMRLRVSADTRAIHFDVTGYRWRLGPIAIPWPIVLTPGTLRVSHSDIDGRNFRFTLVATHPLLGETVRQDGVFAELTED